MHKYTSNARNTYMNYGEYKTLYTHIERPVCAYTSVPDTRTRTYLRMGVLSLHKTSRNMNNALLIATSIHV